MATAKFVRFSVLIPWLFFLYCSNLLSFTLSEELLLVVSESTTLQLSPSLVVEKSPGIKPGEKVKCERVLVHGLPRLQNLGKFANSVMVKVSYLNLTARPPNVDVCFHRNASLGIGMCPQEKFEKLAKGLWVNSMSPFDHKILDIRMASSVKGTLEVSLEEEFYFNRVVLLVMGIITMTLASLLSESLVFYYSSAMAVGVILVMLMVLFQGMKLLPTGRKSSIGIFLYSSMIGLGSFMLTYVPRLIRSVLVELGLGEDIHNPLAVFLLGFLILTGAWLGFWVVRKFVLTEDGSVDVGVSQFVSWSIWIFGSTMVLQSSVDILLAGGTWLSVILLSIIWKKLILPMFLRHVDYQKPSRVEHSYKEHDVRSSKTPKLRDSLFNFFGMNNPVTTTKPTRQVSDSDTFYSSFHNTSERRKFTKDEWENFTKDSTKKALEGLVSSPGFSEWAVSHADRLTLTPSNNAVHHPKRRWAPWL